MQAKTCVQVVLGGSKAELLMHQTLNLTFTHFKSRSDHQPDLLHCTGIAEVRVWIHVQVFNTTA